MLQTLFLLQLNHHLRQVHRLSLEDRRSWIKSPVFSHQMSSNNFQKPTGEKELMKRQDVKTDKPDPNTEYKRHFPVRKNKNRQGEKERLNRQGLKGKGNTLNGSHLNRVNSSLYIFQEAKC